MDGYLILFIHRYDFKRIVCKYHYSLKDPKFICLMISSIANTNNSIQYLSFICTQLNVKCTKNWRCPWCNGYRRRKWTRRHEFKSWTTLMAFHIALIPLGKVWIQLFSLQLWVNSSLGEATSLGEGKLCKTLLKNWPCVISCPSRVKKMEVPVV